MAHPGRLEGKAAIVTGGGLGLGEGIVRKFVEQGARVLLFEINPTNGNRVADALGKDVAQAYQGDVTKENDWKGALSACIDAFGRCDIVVNNAGVVHTSAVPESEYERIMKINVSPLYHSAKVVHPHFKQQGHGVFVNLSSISAPRPRPNLVWYAGSKGAVSAVTKGLAAEFAPDGVRCNAICPVIAETGMVSSVLGGTDTPEGRAVVMRGIPLGRFATPQDIGNAACFLASEEASFITGIALRVDGGRSLQ